MKREDRLDLIRNHLEISPAPLAGESLSQLFGVSRQTIVQDIQSLKSQGHDIVSTHRGYLLMQKPRPQRVFQVRHQHAQIGDELATIVEAGGRIIDVYVLHPMYGKLQVPLNIGTLGEVETFTRQLEEGKLQPLMHLTDAVHFHTVSALDEMVLEEISQRLKKKGYLI